MEKEKIEGNFSQKRTIMVFVILLCLLFTSIGIFIGYKLGNNDADVNTSNNENTNNDDNIENNNNIDEEINNDFDENDIIEVKNKLKDDIDIYMYLDPLNKKYTCNDNRIDISCINTNTIANIILKKADTDNIFTNKADDENEGVTKDYITFATVKMYAKNMFAIDDYKDLPNGENLGDYCYSYKNNESGYERIKDWASCSFGAHSEIINNKWHALTITDNDYVVDEKNIYVEVSYYYLTGEDLYNHNEDTLYCIDSTKAECVNGSPDKLQKDKLTKVRYNFSYDNNILTFKNLETIK